MADTVFINDRDLRENTGGHWYKNVSPEDASENELVALVPLAEVLKLRDVLQRLLDEYDEERQAIDCWPEGKCRDCNPFTPIPPEFTGYKCAYHEAIALTTPPSNTE